jgi:hypothetical protein
MGGEDLRFSYETYGSVWRARFMFMFEGEDFEDELEEEVFHLEAVIILLR